MHGDGAPARVLLVTAAGERGGAEVTLERLAAHLAATRYAPILAAPAGSPLAASWRSSGFSVIATPPVRRLSDLPQTRRTIAALARRIAELDVDLVHTHGIAAQLHAGLAARRAGRPVVSHVQDIFDPSWTRNGLLHRLSLAVPRTATIASSSAVAASLGRRGRRGCCDVIPNPVEAEIVAPVDREGPLVLWCGRLQRWKGCHLFLDAARQVREARPDARFAVVGGTAFGLEPDYAEELRRRAAALGLSPAIEFTGHVDDPRPWMRAAALFVHSSERPEPFGLVMAEAMVQERPVVAFQHGGAAEIVVDGETGRLVPPGDTTALARAICGLLSDPATSRAMGCQGRRRAVQLYGVESVARRVEAVYDHVLEQRPLASAGRGRA